MTRWMFVVAGVLATAPWATAQTRALVTTVLPDAAAPPSAARDLLIDLDGGGLVTQWPGAVDGSYPNLGHRAVLSADGRYVVGPYMRLPITIPPVYPIAYRDLVTGASGSITRDVWWMASNPRRPQGILGLTSGDVGVVDTSGLRTQAACGPNIPSAVAVARDGREFYVACFNSLRVLDATTLAELRRFTLPSSPREMHVVAGHRLFTLDSAGPIIFGTGEMSVYDLTTGARLANAPTPVPGRLLDWAVPSPDGTRVVVGIGASFGAGGSRPYVVDALSAAVVDTWPVDQVTRVAFTSTGRRAVLLREEPNGSTAMLQGVLLDVASKTVLAQGVLGVTFAHDMSNLVIVEPPLAPEALTAAVAGSTVALGWALAPTSLLATDYVLEVGTTADAADLLTLRLGSVSTTLVAPGVPSGSYFVRLRAMNAAGTSAPSSTIQVQVP